MEYKVGLKEMPVGEFTVEGLNLAVIDKVSGNTYLTSKPYIDKLFRLTGYKNLRVVQILDEYAGKSITHIDDLGDQKLYVDDLTDSFIITSSVTMNWISAMNKFLCEDNGFKIKEVRRQDTYYFWDQIVFSNRFGSTFVVYVDFCNEYARVLSISKDDSGVLVGLVDEGSYQFSEGQSSFDSFKILVSGNVDVSSSFNPNQLLSTYEYVTIMKKLGYVTTKRGKYYRTDLSEEVITDDISFESTLDACNEMTWLQRRIKPTSDKVTFYDMFKLISINLDHMTYWDFVEFYASNSSETSDMFVLNS